MVDAQTECSHCMLIEGHIALCSVDLDITVWGSHRVDLKE